MSIRISTKETPRTFKPASLSSKPTAQCSLVISLYGDQAANHCHTQEKMHAEAATVDELPLLRATHTHTNIISAATNPPSARRHHVLHSGLRFSSPPSPFVLSRHPCKIHRRPFVPSLHLCKLRPQSRRLVILIELQVWLCNEMLPNALPKLSIVLELGLKRGTTGADEAQTGRQWIGVQLQHHEAVLRTVGNGSDNTS